MTRPYCQLFDGSAFYFADPPSTLAKTINIKNIATGLAQECRWAGAALKKERVAEHCVLLTRYARTQGHSDAVQFALLMHDAPEGLGVRDVANPIKRFMRELAGGGAEGAVSAYDFVENNVMSAIAIRYGIDTSPETMAIVKDYDFRIMWDERQAGVIAYNPELLFWGDPNPLGVNVEFWVESKARASFLREFNRLCPPEFNY